MSLLLALTMAAFVPQVGDIHRIRIERQTERKDDDGSSGSSFDRDTLIERVVAVRDDGIELEYDLPAETTRQERARVWQFPARVFRPNQGLPLLLDVPTLERRRDRWLKQAKWPAAVCGRWLFTWAAFKIDCDPQAILPGIARFDPWPPLLEPGAPYRDADALGTAPLVAGINAGKPVLTAELPLDLEKIRRSRAEGDLVNAEITGKPPPTLADALRAHAGETIAGTLRVTFDLTLPGADRRLTRITNVSIREADGTTRHMTSTETIERYAITDVGK